MPIRLYSVRARPGRYRRLEDVGLAVRGAPLARNPTWLPAVEQFGEGLFFTLDPDALRDWGARAQDRLAKLEVGADRSLHQRRQRGENISDRAIRDQLRPEYLLAHSLAHALITEVAIDCGYPASSIRERIYIFSEAWSCRSRGRDSYLHGVCGKPGHTRRACRGRPSVCTGVGECLGKATTLLRRSSVRRSRSGDRNRRPVSSRCRSPRLPGDRRNQLRSPQSLLGSRVAGRYGGTIRHRLLSSFLNFRRKGGGVPGWARIACVD